MVWVDWTKHRKYRVILGKRGRQLGRSSNSSRQITTPGRGQRRVSPGWDHPVASVACGAEKNHRPSLARFSTRLATWPRATISPTRAARQPCGRGSQGPSVKGTLAARAMVSQGLSMRTPASGSSCVVASAQRRSSTCSPGGSMQPLSWMRRSACRNRASLSAYRKLAGPKSRSSAAKPAMTSQRAASDGGSPRASRHSGFRRSRSAQNATSESVSPTGEW